MIEIDFAAHQTMQPRPAHSKALPEHMDVAGVICTSDEDHAAAHWRPRVKLKVPWHRSARRCRFSNGLDGRTVCSNMTPRACLQVGETRHSVAQPDFGLPQGVEALDDVLHAVLERGHEHENNIQLQAQPADATDSVSKLMRPLEHGVVVELRVSGQSIALPALQQTRHGGSGAHAGQGPSIGECPVQALGGKHVDQWPIGDLQVFN
jgi:hypothetical protein